MNRRGFLGLLAGAIGAVALLPTQDPAPRVDEPASRKVSTGSDSYLVQEGCAEVRPSEPYFRVGDRIVCENEVYTVVCVDGCCATVDKVILAPFNIREIRRG